MNKWKRTVILLGLLVIFATSGTLALAKTTGGFSLPWWTVDGGGGSLNGGNYTLHATIGQPDAGTSSGGNYTLVGGYWSGSSSPPPAPSGYDIFLPLVLR